MKSLFKIPGSSNEPIQVHDDSLKKFAELVYLYRAKIDNRAIRDYKIIVFLSEGKRSKEIAELTELSPRTVEAFILNLLKIFNAHTHAHLIKILFDHGILKPAATGSGN